MFYLVKLVPKDDEFIEEPIPDHGPFEKGPQAAAAAKALTLVFGYKVQPRRMAQAGNWREKITATVAGMKSLPAAWDIEPITDHFAHLAANEGLVEFIENEEHGIIGRFTQVTPGRYLERYYPNMRDVDRRRYAAMLDPSSTLFIGTSAAEFIKVYDSGGSKGSMRSCMTTHYRSAAWPTPIHPVGVYAYGDLAIAYTKTKSGNIAERSIVFPERKFHSRVYSDGTGKLQRLLHDAGFKMNDSGAPLEGARIRRVEFKYGGQTKMVLPYIDAGFGSGAGACGIKVMDDHLVITRETRACQANETSGCVNARREDYRERNFDGTTTVYYREPSDRQYSEVIQDPEMQPATDTTGTGPATGDRRSAEIRPNSGQLLFETIAGSPLPNAASEILADMLNSGALNFSFGDDAAVSTAP